MRLGEPLALQRDPIRVVTRQQLATVKLRGMDQPPAPFRDSMSSGGGLERGLELRDVRLRRCRVELDRLLNGADDAPRGHIGRLELMAERGKRLAEALAAGTRLPLRPAELSQHLAGMGALAEVGQVGEQVSGLLRAEARDHLIAARGSQPTEQLDAPASLHGARFLIGASENCWPAAGKILSVSRGAGAVWGAPEAADKRPLRCSLLPQ